MHPSRSAYFINPIFENDIQKSASVESLRLQKQTTNRTEEGTGHSSGNSWNQHKPLNSEKANSAQGSIRALLALVIIVCLISLVALLLTLLMLSGKIGTGNEASYSASAKTRQTDLANIKAFEENLTSLQLALVDGIDSQLYQLKSALNRTNSDLAQLSNTQTKVKSLESAVTQLKFALNRSDTDHAEQLNNTQTKLEKLDSALNRLNPSSNRTSNDLAEPNSTQTKLKKLDSAVTQLKFALNRSDTDHAEQLNNTQTKLEDLDSALNQLRSALNRTNNDLAELNSTQTKEKVIYHQTMTPPWIEAYASYISGNRWYTTEKLTFNAGSIENAALFKVPMIPEDELQNSNVLTVKIVASNDDIIGSDVIYGVSDGISFVGFETVDNVTYKRNYAPCVGMEGTSGSQLTRRRAINPQSLSRPSDSFYPGPFVITLKLDESWGVRWGSCYTAHDAGFVKTAEYNERLLLSKGLTLEVYKDQSERAGIKFIEVTIIQDV